MSAFNLAVKGQLLWSIFFFYVNNHITEKIEIFYCIFTVKSGRGLVMFFQPYFILNKSTYPYIWFKLFFCLAPNAYRFYAFGVWCQYDSYSS